MSQLRDFGLILSISLPPQHPRCPNCLPLYKFFKFSLVKSSNFPFFVIVLVCCCFILGDPGAVSRVGRKGGTKEPLGAMVGHLFQNYATIYVRFFVTYTCVLSYFVGFLFPSIWPFSYKRAYICAQKKPTYICVTNKHVYWDHGKSSYKRHRTIPSTKNPFMYDRAEK